MVDYINESNQTEEVLRDANQFNIEIVSQAGEGIIVYDRDLRYVVWNRFMERMTGALAEDVIGRNALDLFPHLHEHGVDQLLKRALDGETGTSPDIPFYSTFTDKNGWVMGTYAPHRNARGEIIGVIATLQDITERKRTEEALRDSENKLAIIIEFLPDATFVIDLEGKVVAWNRAMEEMTGIRKIDMIGQGDHAYTVPFYGERRQQLLDLLDIDDKEIASKYQYVQRKGDTLYAETFAPALHGGEGAYVWATVGPIFDVHGNRAGAIESIRDITERKRAEYTLQEAKRAAENSKARYEQVVSMISDIVCRFDVNAQGEIIGSYISPVADRLLGLPDGTIGNSLDKYFSYVHPDDLPIVQEILSEEIQTLGKDKTAEYRLQKADGTTLWVRSKGSAHSQADGRITVFGTTSDIADRKRVEEELKRTQSNIRIAMDLVKLVRWEYDVETDMFAFDDQFYALWGTTAEREGGPLMSSQDYARKFIPAEDASIVAEEISKALATTNPKFTSQVEHRIIRADGTEGVIAVRFGITKDSKGHTIRTYGANQDITDRKRAEDALRESEQRLANIIDFLPDATFAVDQEGKVIAWNRAIEDMTGISKDDMLDRGGYAYAVPFYGKPRPTLIDLVIQDQKDIESIYTNILRKGDQIIAEASTPMLNRGKGAYLWGIASPLYDRRGSIVGAIQSIRDITDRKQMEVALRESKDYLDEIINSIGDPMFVKDRQHRFILVNDAFCAVTDHTREEFIGKTDYDFFPREQVDVFWEKEELVFQTGKENVNEELITDPQGSTHTIVTKKTLYTDASENKSIVGIIRDITDRKKVEEDLARKNAEMERFTYTVSHDLRSPLVTVSGFVGLLKGDLDRGDSLRAFSDLSTISEAITKMDRLLVDTLKLSRIGRVVNPPENVPFGQVVQEALRQTAERIESRNVAVYVAGDMPKVRVDVLRIAEVLVNLIENSVKYMGDQEKPEMDIGSRKDGEETVLFVKDNGMGIGPKEHEKVFGLFYKVDRNSEGTGAGLSIVKRIIEVHGGRIWIESELGEGCTVCFTLPLADY